MLDIDNPYQSPPGPTLRPLSEDRPWTDAAQVSFVDYRLLYRRVVIEAPLEADLEYHGIAGGGQAITVDRQLVSHKSGLWGFVPRFEFELPSAGRRVPVVVEVRVGWLLDILAFRVEIAGQTVYSEGTWKSPCSKPTTPT